MGMFKTKHQKSEAPRKMHVRKNDEVVVTAGKDRGKRGKVLRVIPSAGTAIVERVNFQKKHSRANPQKNIQGGVLEREAPLKASNLMVVCPSCSEPTRIGARTTDDGSTRTCKKCDADIS